MLMFTVNHAGEKCLEMAIKSNWDGRRQMEERYTPDDISEGFIRRICHEVLRSGRGGGECNHLCYVRGRYISEEIFT